MKTKRAASAGWRRVVLESPFAGDVDANRAYAIRAMRDCLESGEAPMVSHLLYTQTLDDDVPGQRVMGITAGHAWIAAADAMVVYQDRGISPGMERGIECAMLYGVPVEYRTIGA